MTNAPEGRTYESCERKALNSAVAYYDVLRADWCFPEEDFVNIWTKHVVPNGMWVMERQPGRLVGVTRDEIEELELCDESGIHTVLCVSKKPFGYIVPEFENEYEFTDNPWPSVTHTTLRYARQVHKGELSQAVPLFKEVAYVRADDKKRGNGWVRLTDLAIAAGHTVEEIVFGYWEFSGHRNYWYYENDQEGGQLLDIVVAQAANEIEHKVPTVEFATKDEADRLIRESFEDLWVRRGFAYTTLRLMTLGIQPLVTQFA